MSERERKRKRMRSRGGWIWVRETGVYMQPGIRRPICRRGELGCRIRASPFSKSRLSETDGERRDAVSEKKEPEVRPFGEEREAPVLFGEGRRETKETEGHLQKNRGNRGAEKKTEKGRV